MSSDQRQWYRDWWRKKTGYTERATFRLGEHDVKRSRHASAWRRNFRAFVLVLLFIAAFAIIKRL